MRNFLFYKFCFIFCYFFQFDNLTNYSRIWNWKFTFLQCYLLYKSFDNNIYWKCVSIHKLHIKKRFKILTCKQIFYESSLRICRQILKCNSHCYVFDYIENIGCVLYDLNEIVDVNGLNDLEVGNWHRTFSRSYIRTHKKFSLTIIANLFRCISSLNNRLRN